MVSEWEKQILAYCIRVSRGAVRKGLLKMSVFPEHEAQVLGGLTAVQFVDIVSYLARLHVNLKDPIRRRGFNCMIEVGTKIYELLEEVGYQLSALNKDFSIIQHDGYPNEVKFSFVYEPSISPTIVFEDIEVSDDVAERKEIETLDDYQKHFEALMQQKFIQEFDFIEEESDKKNIQKKNNVNTKS